MFIIRTLVLEGLFTASFKFVSSCRSYPCFPGDAVNKNLPANAGDTGSIPRPGRIHVLQSNQAHMPQLLKPTCLEPGLHSWRCHGPQHHGGGGSSPRPPQRHTGRGSSPRPPQRHSGGGPSPRPPASQWGWVLPEEPQYRSEEAAPLTSTGESCAATKTYHSLPPPKKISF